MRVTADRSKCQGYGTCVLVMPSVFDLDEDGYVRLLEESVPDDSRADVTRAVRECPARALSLAD